MQWIVSRADDSRRLGNALDGTHVIGITTYYYYFTDLFKYVEFCVIIA
jgi:hypothetical protein